MDILNAKMHRIVLNRETFLKQGYSETYTLINEKGEEVVVSSYFGGKTELVKLDVYFNVYRKDHNLEVVNQEEYDELNKQYIAQRKSKVSVINRDTFIHAKEVSNVHKKYFTSDVSYYSLLPKIRSNLVYWFCCFKGRFFEIVDDADSSHEHIMQRIVREAELI